MESRWGNRFLVACSDGVWEFLSNKDVVGMVQSCSGDATKVSLLSVSSHRERSKLTVDLWRGPIKGCQLIASIVDSVECVEIYHLSA